MARKITIEIITALLVLLFIYAATSKMIGYARFQFQLSRAPYVGQFAILLSYVIPLGELVIVALLTISKTRYLGLWLSFVSMLIFTVYVALMLLSGKHLPCTCGGIIQKLSWSQHLVFNLFFSVLSGTGIWLYRKKKGERKGERLYAVTA